MKYIILLVATLSLYACGGKEQKLEDKQKELETGLLDSTNTYTAEEIGWTMNVLPDWEVQTKETIKKNNERGKEALEETIGSEIDASSLVQLINLKKGRFNSLLSNIEPLNGTTPEAQRKTVNMMFEVVKQTFSEKGIKADYIEDSTLIDGLNFTVFRIKMYNDDRSEVILRQVLYNRLLNGYSFTVNINCRDEELMDELETMLFSSKFTKRE